VIRRVQLKDIDEIMQIERQSFPVAWEYTIFLNICIRKGQVSSGESGTIFMDVLELNNRVIGYSVWEFDRRKAEGHILNLAIHPNERRKGNGRRMLLSVVEQLITLHTKLCRLEVRESNIPARALYEASGFKPSGKIAGYYFDEDAIVYTKHLQS
jgi:ribosomal-protein-alanine N-acetyltransferase